MMGNAADWLCLRYPVRTAVMQRSASQPGLSLVLPLGSRRSRAGPLDLFQPTDPAAAWNTKEGRGRFGYFTNYMIDTEHAIIVDVEATPARMAQEIIASKAMLDRIEEIHELKPPVLTADAGYGTGPFLAWLKEREITAHIPVRDYQHLSGMLPREAFTFDAERNVFICPQGKILKHRTARSYNRIHTYRATASDCKNCPIKAQCTRGTKRALSVPFDEAARLEVIALQNTPAFQRSRIKGPSKTINSRS